MCYLNITFTEVYILPSQDQKETGFSLELTLVSYGRKLKCGSLVYNISSINVTKWNSMFWCYVLVRNTGHLQIFFFNLPEILCVFQDFWWSSMYCPCRLKEKTKKGKNCLLPLGTLPKVVHILPFTCHWPALDCQVAANYKDD